MPAFSNTFSFSIALTQAQAALEREREAQENGIANLHPEDVGPINELIYGEVGMVRPSEAHQDLASLLRDEYLSVSGVSASECGMGMLRTSEACHDLASILRSDESSPSGSCDCCAVLELDEDLSSECSSDIELLRPSPAYLDLASLRCSVDSHDDEDEDVSSGSCDESSEDSHSIWAFDDQNREIGVLTPSPACLDLASILNPDRLSTRPESAAADGLDGLSATVCLGDSKEDSDSEQSELLDGQRTPKCFSDLSFDDWNPPHLGLM